MEIIGIILHIISSNLEIHSNTVSLPHNPKVLDDIKLLVIINLDQQIEEVLLG